MTARPWDPQCGRDDRRRFCHFRRSRNEWLQAQHEPQENQCDAAAGEFFFVA